MTKVRRWVGMVLAAGTFLLSLQVAPAQAQVNFTPRAQVSFTFDDSFASAYTKAAPILASQGYSGTAYVTTGFVDKPGYMTWDQVLALRNSFGWEIGAHTVTHPLLTQLSPSQVETELSQSKSILQSKGINPTAFASPYGDYNNQVLPTIAKYYSSHRGFHDQDYNTWPHNNYLLYVKQVQAGVSVETVKSYINEAKANKKWLILVFHDIKDNPSADPADYQYGTSQLQQIVNYTKSQNLPVVDVSEGLLSGKPNLVANSSFESGLTQGWTTDDEQNIRVVNTNRGSYPSPRNAVQMTSGNKNTHLFSPRVNVAYGNDYAVKQYLSTTQTAAGIGFYIDEYDANGNWISGQYKATAPEAFTEEIGFSYSPSSAAVQSAQLQIILLANSNTLAYLDNVQWYSVR